jgi:hypothetical protein
MRFSFAYLCWLSIHHKSIASECKGPYWNVIFLPTTDSRWEFINIKVENSVTQSSFRNFLHLFSYCPTRNKANKSWKRIYTTQLTAALSWANNWKQKHGYINTTEWLNFATTHCISELGLFRKSFSWQDSHKRFIVLSGILERLLCPQLSPNSIITLNYLRSWWIYRSNRVCNLCSACTFATFFCSTGSGRKIPELFPFNDMTIHVHRKESHKSFNLCF